MLSFEAVLIKTHLQYKNQDKRLPPFFILKENHPNLDFYIQTSLIQIHNTMQLNIFRLYFLLMSYNKFSVTSLIFLTILILLYIPLPIRASIPGLYIDRLTLSSQGATHDYKKFNSSSNFIAPLTKNFSFSWREILPTLIKVGLSVHNYQMRGASFFFSYQVYTQNVTTNGMDIYLETFQSSTSWVCFLTFNVIVVAVDSLNIQLISHIHNFTQLNVWNRSQINQTFSSTFTKFNLTSSKPSIKIILGLSYIKFDNNFSQNYSQFVFQLFSQSVNSLEIIFSSENFNSLVQAQVIIFIIDCGAFLPNLAYYFGSAGKGSTQYQKPLIFVNSTRDNTSIFSITQIKLNFNQTGFLDFTLGSNQNIIGSQGSKQSYTFYYHFLNNCPINYFVEYTANSSLCILCSEVLTNCINCTNGTVCILCQAVATIVDYKCILCNTLIYNCAFCSSASKCLKCFKGFVAIGGCTMTIGCIEVGQIMNNNYACVACNQTLFKYNFTDNLCYCKQGKLVGEYCTTVYGCLSTTMIGSSVVCTFCNMSLRLQIKNQNCVCIYGYELKQGTCVDICGDGIIFTSQCDDGNLIDGDGCSSQCKTQFLYKCTKDSKASSCAYYGLNLNISLVSTQKLQTQNQVMFSFKFQPDIPNLAYLDLKNYFIFKCQNASYSVEKWVYSNGFANLYVDYSTPLQGKNVIVDFILQNQYVHHSPIELKYTIKSTKGGKLLIQKSNGQQKVMSFMLFVFSGLGIFMVVFCSWLHKMIGVQFLFVSQIVYYAHFGISQYDSSISIFQYLCFSSFNYRAKTFSFINFTMYPQFQAIQYSSTVADTTILTLGVILLLPILFMIVLQILNKKIVSLKRVAQKQMVLTHIVSPLLLSYTFPFFFISSTQLIRGNLDSNSFLSPYLRAIILFFITSLYFLNLNHFTQRLFLFPNLQNTKVNCFVEGAKDCYLFVFQLLMISSLIICSLWIKLNFSFCLLSMIGIFGAMFFWQLIIRPYNNLIDNIGISLNILFTLVYLILIILRNSHILQQSQANSEIMKYASIPGLTLCCLFSIIRLIQAIRRKLSKKHLENIIQTKIEQQKIQPLSLITQKGKEKSESKKSAKNMKQTAIIQNYDRVMPILGFNASNKQQKEVNLSKEYQDIVQNYRRKFRKNKLAVKINSNDN